MECLNWFMIEFEIGLYVVDYWFMIMNTLKLKLKLMIMIELNWFLFEY